jgi:hypothetical protein
MKKLFLNITFLLLAQGLFSQNTETRPLHTVTKLVITGKTFSAEIIQGDENKVEITSADLTMDKILTTESNGELKVSVKGLFTTGDAKLKIYLKTLPATIEINNGAYLKSEVNMAVGQISLITNSDGYIRLNLTAENIVLQCNTGGDATLEGTTQSLSVSANTNATVRATAMEVNNGVIKAYLGAEIYVKVKDNLACTTGTGGKIHVYKPYPTNITETNESGGEVVRE